MVNRGRNKNQQPTTTMQNMPQNENKFVPRQGQEELIRSLPTIERGDTWSVQWPTGYGKSIGFALTWMYCHEKGIANRLLLVVANDTQREQMVNDFAGDCNLVGAPCPEGVYAYKPEPATLMVCRKGDCLVFVCTVHQLSQSMSGDTNLIESLLTTEGTRWMIGFDEYHHYGEGKSWGISAQEAMKHSQFNLAMSATPDRRHVNTIFEKPSIYTNYTRGVEEKVLKPMVCAAYEYQVTIDDQHRKIQYTTSELVEACDGIAGLSAWEEKRSIRYVSEFLHPLLIHPIERLYEKRRSSGKKVQMLIRAMSCGHAKMLYDQVKQLTESLSVDWVGTGDYGRADQENKDVLSRFCPAKVNGERPEPGLDILIQVAMAGEGMDCIFVSEIVDFYPVSNKAKDGKATQDKQFYGRGARWIKGWENGDQICHINVPTDHHLAKWSGETISEWMDASGDDLLDIPTHEIEKMDNPSFDFFLPEIPEYREVDFIEIVDEARFKRVSQQFSDSKGYDLKNPEHLAEIDRIMRGWDENTQRAQSMQTHMALLREYVDGVVRKMAGKKCYVDGVFIAGEMQKNCQKINADLKRRFGARDKLDCQQLTRLANHVYETGKRLGLRIKETPVRNEG